MEMNEQCLCGHRFCSGSISDKDLFRVEDYLTEWKKNLRKHIWKEVQFKNPLGVEKNLGIRLNENTTQSVLYEYYATASLSKILDLEVGDWINISLDEGLMTYMRKICALYWDSLEQRHVCYVQWGKRERAVFEVCRV
jgi:hypothetical protein